MIADIKALCHSAVARLHDSVSYFRRAATEYAICGDEINVIITLYNAAPDTLIVQTLHFGTKLLRVCQCHICINNREEFRNKVHLLIIHNCNIYILKHIFLPAIRKESEICFQNLFLPQKRLFSSGFVSKRRCAYLSSCRPKQR